MYETFQIDVFTKKYLVIICPQTLFYRSLKGIVFYLTMSILKEQAVHRHHNGVILSFLA